MSEEEFYKNICLYLGQFTHEIGSTERDLAWVLHRHHAISIGRAERAALNPNWDSPNVNPETSWFYRQLTNKMGMAQLITLMRQTIKRVEAYEALVDAINSACSQLENINYLRNAIFHNGFYLKERDGEWTAFINSNYRYAEGKGREIFFGVSELQHAVHDLRHISDVFGLNFSLLATLGQPVEQDIPTVEWRYKPLT